MRKLDLFIPTYVDYIIQSLKIDNNNKKSYMKQYGDFPLVPNLECIAMLNRFPTMPVYYAYKYFNDVNADKKLTKLRRNIKNTTKDPIKDILEFNKMPTGKLYKKRVLSNFENPNYFNQLKKVIDNNDNVNKILNEDFLYRVQYYDINSIVKDIEKLKEIKGFNLNSFCNRVEGVDKTIIVDALHSCIKMYDKKPDYKFNFKCKIQELHDTVSKDFNKLKHPNIPIEYPEEAKDLEGKYGELYFNLAKDTHELIDVGTEMSICVGGYGDRAVEKKLNIIVARNKEGFPIVCIEMNRYYYDIHQTKQKHNNMNKAFNEEESPMELNAVMEWAKIHNLRFATWDIPEHLKEKHNNLPGVIKKGKEIEKLIYEENKDKGIKINPELNGLQLNVVNGQWPLQQPIANGELRPRRAIF
jgi:hypothetical protein